MAHRATPQSPEDVGFNADAFEFAARGLQPEVREENDLPEAEDEVDEMEGMEVPMAEGEFEADEILKIKR